MIFGKGKILHFGMVAHELIVCYSIWVLVMQFGISLPLAILFALTASVITGLGFAWLSLRLEEDAFGVMSIALHLMVLSVVLNWQSVTRGALGIPRIPRAPFPETLEGYALMVISLMIVWLLILWRIDRGSFGRKLTALSEHGWHAASLGVQRVWVHSIAFVLAGIGIVIGYTLFPPYLYLVTPTDFHFPTMIFYVMVVVAGGPGKIWGVAIATFAIVFLREGVRFIDLPHDMVGPVRLILFGLILFISVYLRRDKVFPKARTI